MIDDLYKLTLVDGIPATQDGKTIRYRQVHLRETTLADERAALRIAERVVPVGGVPKLLVSEADFRYAMTMRHIEEFRCDGQRIPQPMIDMEIFGKLSSHDLGLIEARVFIITMAAELRYGTINQAEFDAIVAGQQPGAQQAPQPVGQAADLGQAGPGLEPGPALLADYLRDLATGAPAGAGQ